MAHLVKNPPAMWETLVQSPGQKDPPEKEVATHFSTLAWKIPWTEKPGRLQSTGSQITYINKSTKKHTGYPNLLKFSNLKGTEKKYGYWFHNLKINFRYW